MTIKKAEAQYRAALEESSRKKIASLQNKITILENKHYEVNDFQKRQLKKRAIYLEGLIKARNIELAQYRDKERGTDYQFMNVKAAAKMIRTKSKQYDKCFVLTSTKQEQTAILSLLSMSTTCQDDIDYSGAKYYNESIPKEKEIT